MKTLTVPYGKLPQEPSGYIDNYRWDSTGYCPKGELYLSYDKENLYIKLFAPITEELTILTTRDNGPVWEDNCLEFFFAPFGEEDDYLNIECNPAAAMVIGKGNDRHDRTSVVAYLKPLLAPKTEIRAGEGWSVTYAFPFAAIREIFGKPFLAEKGAKFYFNAYLCGEKTPIMHFGSWSPIDTENPDFHRPEFFGLGELG